MKYIEVLLGWCLINIYLCFVAYASKYNMFHFMLFFFAGVFVILIYGFFEAIKKEKESWGCLIKRNHL